MKQTSLRGIAHLALVGALCWLALQAPARAQWVLVSCTTNGTASGHNAGTLTVDPPYLDADGKTEVVQVQGADLVPTGGYAQVSVAAHPSYVWRWTGAGGFAAGGTVPVVAAINVHFSLNSSPVGYEGPGTAFGSAGWPLGGSPSFVTDPLNAGFYVADLDYYKSYRVTVQYGACPGYSGGSCFYIVDTVIGDTGESIDSLDLPSGTVLRATLTIREKPDIDEDTGVGGGPVGGPVG